MLKAVKISDHVYWVGAIDWDLRNFHGYATHRGTSYNAYLILAEKVTLVETVKAPFKNEMLERIASVIEPSKIKYLVSGHAEMDHSGCIPDMINLVKPEKVFASTAGVEALHDHFHLDKKTFTPVKDGESLSLGNMSLKFIETRMLHWPDSMFSYLAEERVLFSQDAFGMHLASHERFADEIDEAVWLHEAAKYYANILLPYSNFVLKLIERWNGLNIDPKIVATDHGPVWRDGGAKIIPLYAKWAGQKRTNKGIVVFDTMWESTAKMAKSIGEGLAATGARSLVMSIGPFNRSDVALEILDAGAFIIGSPTLNNAVLPTIADVMNYIKGLRPKNLVGAAFGSYGWGGESIKELDSMLKEMKVEPISEGLKVKYVPTGADLERCFQLGKQIGERIINNV